MASIAEVSASLVLSWPNFDRQFLRWSLQFLGSSQPISGRWPSLPYDILQDLLRFGHTMYSLWPTWPYLKHFPVNHSSCCQMSLRKPCLTFLLSCSCSLVSSHLSILLTVSAATSLSSSLIFHSVFIIWASFSVIVSRLSTSRIFAMQLYWTPSARSIPERTERATTIPRTPLETLGERNPNRLCLFFVRLIFGLFFSK